MLKRLGRHLLPRRTLPAAALGAIEQAIRESERQHDGQIVFAVETALDIDALLAGQTARERAVEVFSELRVWDTAQNNGVLVYLLLADRDIEIVADRGVDARVGARQWERICADMEASLAAGRYPEAIVAGIQAISREISKHFPLRGAGRGELRDQPVVLS